MTTIDRRTFVQGMGLGIAGLACSSLLSSCASDSSAPEGYVSPYDLSAITFSNGRASYSEGGRACSLIGVDVSDHDEAIDWLAVSRDNIDFAIVRLGYRGSTEGDIHADERGRLNLASAKAVDLPCGAYFFSQAISDDEAREEAEFAIKALGDTHLEMPLVFDQEPTGDGGRSDNLDAAQLTSNARVFCDAVSKAGFKPMIYGNMHDVARLDLDQLADYPMWFAEYETTRPDAEFDLCMWQYTDTGKVDGISGGVDLSIYFTDDCAKRPWKGKVL